MMKKFTLSAIACMLMGVFTAQAQITESFDIAETPDGWTVINMDSLSTNWEFGPPPGEYTPHSGAGVAFINWSQGHDDYLITPQFTVTADATDQLRFYSRNWGTPGAPNSSDIFNVELSTTGNAAEDFTVTLESEIMPPTEWTEYIFNLSEYAGQEIYIAFHAVTDGSQERLYIDDVYVEAMPSCPKPSLMAASVVSFTEVDLSWTENGSATQWEVVYGEPGFDPATGGETEPVSGTPEVSLTGLTPDTHYDYYIRAICGTNDESMFSVKASFFSGYCPFISSSTDRFIAGFSTQNGIENISNLNSGLSPDGYGDFTDMAVSTYADGIFDFNMVFNDPDNWMQYHVGVWIDFNNDLVFDESEMVYLENYASTGASGTIEVPAGTPNGNYRMRVVADGFDYFVSPCDGGDGAEAEDYIVTIMDPPLCLPVSGLEVVNVYAESADLAWTANTGESNWEVLYGEGGFNPAIEGTLIEVTGSSNITLTELDGNTQYDFYVTAICSDDDASSITGPVSFTTFCLPTTLPYSVDFETVVIPGIPDCTSKENTGSGNEWETFYQTQNGFYGNVLRYRYNVQFPGDAWFYTQGIELESGTNYVISYKYGNNSSFSESMKVAFGDSPQKSAMVNQLSDHQVIASAQAETQIINFTAPTTGVYYFGFNAYSAANQDQLFLDDINISEGSMCYDATDIGVSDIDETSATVSWTGSETAAQGHEVSVFLEGEDPETATSAFTETYALEINEAVITGLTHNTTYDVYITALCGGLASNASDVVSFTTEEDLTIGVSNYDITNINYFPNPVKDQLTVTAGSAIESITVYNLLGAAVMQIGSKEADVVVDMSSLPAGAYILKARVAEGVSTFKVIKE